MTGDLIALLTDFGTGDPYVAAMKGVILSARPGARITDITHDIPRHDVTAAAHALRSVEAFFPPRTIFLCVVDPGVGTGRRILCLEKGGRVFLAPDNGLLNLVSDGAKADRWYALKSPGRARTVSATFHGRDVFAPAAARLAGGAPLSSLAERTRRLPAIRLYTDVPAGRGSSAEGFVLCIDRFGNIITNFRMPARARTGLRLSIGGRTIDRICRTYDEGPGRLPFLIRGSGGLLEVSVRRGDAGKLLKVRPGDRLKARR